MAIAPIENSELRTSYVAKVNALIDGWFGEGTAAELETYGEVRAALNAVAADLELEEFENGTLNATTRARINAVLVEV
jgi:hypothetical protein